MTKKRKQILIGVESEREMVEAAVRAWGRAEQGLPAEEPINRLHFEDMPTLLKCLSPRRVELLQKLRMIGPMNIRKLAQALERDYKNVYNDVADLAHVGLIEEASGRRFCVPWDEIAAKFPLLAKAT